ncbi:MAG: anti-anti-sigma factor, partial [Thermoleophilia bacterium]|nr:anti-anti-sigma factor [Thermoleophilia bacterium]
MSGWQDRAKRALDITGASVGLALSAPVIGVTALLVRREDKG